MVGERVWLIVKCRAGDKDGLMESVYWWKVVGYKLLRVQVFGFWEWDQDNLSALHMGQANSPSSDTFPPISLSKLRRLEEGSLFSLWLSPSGRTLEEYKIFVPADRTLEDQIQIYDFRRREDLNLVTVLFVEPLSREYEDSGYRELRVFTERIPLTLNQLSKVDIRLGLSILHQATTGFQLLYNEMGYFEVSDRLIGINSQMEVKVWINSNWAINSPFHPSGRASHSGNQHVFVTHLVEAVQKTIQHTDLLERFIRKRKAVMIWSFSLLKGIIAEFLLANSLKLTKKIDYEGCGGGSENGNEHGNRCGTMFQIPNEFQSPTRKTKGLLENKYSLKVSSGEIELMSPVRQQNLDKEEKVPEKIEFFTFKARPKIQHKKVEEVEEEPNRRRRHTEHILIRQEEPTSPTLTPSSDLARSVVMNQAQNQRTSLARGLKDYMNFTETKPTHFPFLQKNSFNSSEGQDSPEIQFKTSNMRKKKKVEKMDISHALQRLNLPVQSPLRPRERSHSQDKDLSLDTSANVRKSTQLCSSGQFSSDKQSKRNFVSHRKQTNLEEFLSPLNSTSVPIFKSVNGSMIQSFDNKSNTTTSLQSKLREMKESLIVQQLNADVETGTGCKPLGFAALSKKAMAMSINLPGQGISTKKEEKKPMSALDLLILKRNIEKKQEQQLDISIEYETGEQLLHKSIIEGADDYE